MVVIISAASILIRPEKHSWLTWLSPPHQKENWGTLSSERTAEPSAFHKHWQLPRQLAVRSVLLQQCNPP